MKRYLAICALLAGTLQIAIAQKPDTARILVHYKFTHVQDTGNRANPYTENMVLFVGRNSSHYKSYDRQLENELFKKQIQAQLASSPDGSIRISRKIAGSETEYYQFPDNRELVRQELLLINNYLITDALPVINWHISGDTASFGQLHCQKATCHFKGRDYTAWFCPDLPVHIGPWKLNGLPGVIVEACDVKKEVVFKFDRIEKTASAISKEQPADDHVNTTLASFGAYDSDPDIIRVPAKGIKTTGKEFEKFRDAMRRDPNAIANMQGYDGPRPIHINVPPPISNPIELPEK